MWFKYAVSVFRRFSTRFLGICHFFLRYYGIGYLPMSPSLTKKALWSNPWKGWYRRGWIPKCFFFVSHNILLFIILPLFLPYSSRHTYYFLCGYGLSRFKVTNHGPVEHLFKGCFYKGKGPIKASLLNVAKYVKVLSLFSFKLEQTFCSLLF